MAANEPALSYRRLKHSLDYSIRMSSTPTNLAHQRIFHPYMTQYYDKHLNTIPNFGINMIPYMEASEIPWHQYIPYSAIATPFAQNKQSDLKSKIGI